MGGNTGIDLHSDEHKNGPTETASTSQSPFDELTTLYEDLASWPFRRHIETPNMLAVIGNVSGLSILDFGCGTATHSRFLKQAGAARVTGFDPCIRMLQFAKEKARQCEMDIEFTSVLTPEIYNGQFDIVVGAYVLPYANTKTELATMCGQMANLLKPNGRLYTLPMHPDYNLNPDFYEEFGFRLIPQGEPPFAYIDGGPVELHLCHENWDIKIMATYWSRASLNEAFIGAGFSSVSHVDLCKIKSECVCPTLLKYVKQPHASLIECIK